MTVYLVGAGPGDPGLLTRRGAELLAQARVVIYDRLVDSSLLELAPTRAKRINVGKGPGAAQSASQDAINVLLVAEGRVGGVVVRLKGGDPYVFGRGGEEALALEAAGVAYEVVPGVSSVLAAPSAAGVPLTHRALASSFAVLTGHDPHGDDRSWDALAASSATLVVLMGAARSGEVAARVMAAGRPPSTPVVVIERATTPTQSSQRTTLGELGALEVHHPATIVIGAVAGLSLASSEDRRLFGFGVVVTREEAGQSELAGLLEREGARVIPLSTRATAPPIDDGLALRGCLGRLSSFSWLVVASPRAVRALFAELRDARTLGGLRVATLGRASAAAFAERGVVVDLALEGSGGHGPAASVAAAFPPPVGNELPVLVVRSANGRPELVEFIIDLGWQVEAVDAYRSVVPEADGDALERVGEADAVVFASPSAVQGFLSLAGRSRLPRLVVTIGPTTSGAASAAGLSVSAEAQEPTASGLVEAVVRACAAHGGRRRASAGR